MRGVYSLRLFACITMHQQPPRSIDETILSGDYRQEAYTPEQQSLILALCSSREFASWKKPKPLPPAQLRKPNITRADTPHAARQEATRQKRIRPEGARPEGARQRQICQEKRQRPSRAARETIAVERQRGRKQQRSRSPHASASAVRPPAPLVAPQLLSSQNPPFVEPERSRPSKECGTNQRRPAESGESAVKKPTAADLLRLYQPIENPASFFSKLEAELEGTRRHNLPAELEDSEKIFGLYVGKGGRMKM